MYGRVRRDLLATVIKLHRDDLLRLNAGNVSVRASQDHVVITPSGVHYDKMTVDDMVVITMDGERIHGWRNPSSEMPMHLIVYREIPGVNAIVHSHSLYALAFAAAGKGIPVISTEGLAVGGPVPVAEYACPGTETQGWATIKAMKGPPPVKGTLLKNHGVLATGKSLTQAYSIAYQIEIAAKIYYLAKQIGEPIPLTAEQVEEIKKIYLSKKSSL